MKNRTLLVYYSQSGDAERVANALANSLESPHVDLTVERIRPKVEFPFPWKNIRRFFDVLPECLLGPCPEIERPSFDAQEDYALVIVVYQVWFLSPSLPIQGFLRSDAASVLRGKRVITFSVSRNMWHSASETLKAMLARLGAIHTDNVAVTHQGPPWATFVTTPRALIFGKKEGFWGIFPPAGLDDEELSRVSRMGKALSEQVGGRGESDHGPLLRGLGAIRVNRRYLLPELIGRFCFLFWARLIQGLGKAGAWARALGIYAFVVFLVLGVVVGIPAIAVVRLLLFPLIGRWTASYVRRLEQPTGP